MSLVSNVVCFRCSDFDEVYFCASENTDVVARIWTLCDKTFLIVMSVRTESRNSMFVWHILHSKKLNNRTNAVLELSSQEHPIKVLRRTDKVPHMWYKPVFGSIKNLLDLQFSSTFLGGSRERLFIEPSKRLMEMWRTKKKGSLLNQKLLMPFLFHHEMENRTHDPMWYWFGKSSFARLHDLMTSCHLHRIF